MKLGAKKKKKERKTGEEKDYSKEFGLGFFSLTGKRDERERERESESMQD